MDEVDLNDNEATLNEKLEAALKLVKLGKQSQALHCLREGIENDHGHSLWLAGALYDFGEGGVPRRRELAAKYYLRSMELVGSWNATMGLARLAFYGDGVPQNYEGARNLYQSLYEDKADPEAAMMLANCILKLDPSIEERKRAIRLLEEAVEKKSYHAAIDLSNIRREEGSYFKFAKLRLLAGFFAAREASRNG